MASTQSIRQHAVPGHHPRLEHAGNFLRRHWLASGLILLILVVGFLTLQYGNEVLRQRMEVTLNEKLKGYRVSLPGLAFHPLGFSLTLHDLELRQETHPRPPIARIHRIDASVAWRDLLHRRLVADFVIDRPDFHVNLTQLQTEAAEPTKVQDKGWQEAVEAIYPLKINHFVINDGKVTYIDKDPKQAMVVEDIDLDLKNIRNVRAPDDTFPSDVHLSATVFKKGGVQAEGKANFLTTPMASFDVDLELRNIPLDEVKPVAMHANLKLEKGVLEAKGHALITPKKRDVHLTDVTIRGLNVEYLNQAKTQARQAQQIEAVKDAAADVSNEPETIARLDQLAILDSRIAYVDQTGSPHYRVYFSDTDIKLRNVSSQATKEPAHVEARGRFMGSGQTVITSSFRPINKTPEFDLSIEIGATPMSSLNDVFRSYAGFDVSAGNFSFYSEMSAHDGELKGYVKPLLSDMKVYDKEQDKDESTLHKLYERAVGGVANLLENRREDVATKADVSGRVDQPNVRNWQIVLNVLRNAFIQAIRPGLDPNGSPDAG
ncbi:MAG TPA: DUF748 domain-containing protein [Terriglobales bacterium]|nr:DUF748 domain-containing protein [Terriglobales bacterium]